MIISKGRTGAAAALCAAGMLAAGPASGHPHIWAEARLDVAIADNAVVALQHVWRFDDIFSSTVMIEFDQNADNQLSDEELQEVGDTVRRSIADFDYFQTVIADGYDVEMTPPETILADMQDGRLVLIFESRMTKPLPLSGKLAIAIYDPTFYTAIDYVNDTDMVVEGLSGECKREVVRPDPDEIIAQNQQDLTESFYETTDMTDLSGIFATRLELTCNAQG